MQDVLYQVRTPFSTVFCQERDIITTKYDTLSPHIVPKLLERSLGEEKKLTMHIVLREKGERGRGERVSVLGDVRGTRYGGRKRPAARRSLAKIPESFGGEEWRNEYECV